MQRTRSAIPGCFTLDLPVAHDRRGTFRKTFHAPSFAADQLATEWPEEYFTMSKAGVVRGMHFQLPPHDHAKIVYCLTGAVTDVVLDLRTDSPAFGRAIAFELAGGTSPAVYIPSGCAHGFCARADDSTLFYKVGSVHAPEHDMGVAWDSFGFDWAIEDPIMSDRDLHHPTFEQFNRAGNPFRMPS